MVVAHRGQAEPEESTGLEAVLRVLDAVGTDVELKHVFHRAVEATVAATSADHAAFLVVDGDVLSPQAVAARRPNAELFRRFRAMPAIALADGEIDRLTLLFAGHTVVLEDCRSDALVPPSWLTAFGTTSLAVTPVVVPDEFAAVLAIDYTRSHQFDRDEIAALEGIAQATRAAVESDLRRRDSSRAHVVRRELAANVSRLADAAALSDVADAVGSTVSALFPRARVSLELLDERLAPHRAPGSGDSRHVLKVAAGRRHFGYLAVDGVPGRGDDLMVLEAVADQAALALDRMQRERELEWRTERAELMQRLADVLRSPASPVTLLARLNREVARPAGFECDYLAMRHQRHVDLFRCRALGSNEGSLLARSADDRHPVVHTASRHEVHVTVPVLGRGAGVLVVTTSKTRTDARDHALMTAIAVGIGQVAHARQLDRALNESAQRLTAAALRKRVVDDLERRLGPPLRALASGLRREVERSSADPRQSRVRVLHDLAMHAVAEAHAVSGTLAAIEVRDAGLGRALRDVARSFERTASIAVATRCDIVDGAVPVDVDETIVAFVYDALALVARPGRCDLVSICVTHLDGVRVEIRDDGVGLEQRVSEDAPLGIHYAIAALRRRVKASGGHLDVRPRSPRGLEMVAVLPDQVPGGGAGGAAGGLVLQLPARDERPVS